MKSTASEQNLLKLHQRHTILVFLRRASYRSDLMKVLAQTDCVALDIDRLISQLPQTTQAAVAGLAYRLLDDRSGACGNESPRHTYVLVSCHSHLEEMADYAVYGPLDALPTYARSLDAGQGDQDGYPFVIKLGAPIEAELQNRVVCESDVSDPYDVGDAFSPNSYED